MLLSVSTLRRSSAWLALATAMALAWWFLVASEAAMSSMRGEGIIMQMMWAMMAPGEPLAYWVSASVMWAVMMVAMMIPAAAPMLSVYRQIYRGPRAEIAALMFACGYLASWTLFSLAAAGLQWLLHSRGVLHGHLLETGAEITAWLLIATGTYQLTPFKEACLARCRSPIGYFMGHWREGPAGGWWLGWRHGLFCIGCCWMLMLLMFAGGNQ